MTVTIHRGTHQIGGCITEVKTERTRVLIDIGAPLPESDTPEIKIGKVVAESTAWDAIFITHYHGDHVGLYKEIPRSVPIYMGEAAKEIYHTLTQRIKDDGAERIKAFHTFRPASKIQIGDITLTPFLVDHSAFDAYMFLIEADGQRILHTGDFRLHGFRGKAVLPTIQKYVGAVDVLICEGTSLSRSDQMPMTEHSLQLRAKQILAEHKYVFVLCSSTNIDRIAAFYHATPRGKYFLCDGYQKQVLNIATAYGGQRTPLYRFQKAVTYGKKLDEKLRARGFCMLVRGSDYFKRIMDKFPDAVFLYSMWRGYLEEPHRSQMLAALAERYPFQSLHTSGHAARADIEAVCNAVTPKLGCIPIHSAAPACMTSLHLNCPTILLNDHEEYELT